MPQNKVYISTEEQPIADAFLKIYEPYAYQGTLEGNLRESKHLKKKIEQCRFCKKARKETTFTQNTHLLSRLIGNNGYYSYDECDECNKLFNILETDLAASLGAERTFNHLLSERKAPGFESGNGNLRIKKLQNENIIVSSKNLNPDDIQVNFTAGNANISMHTQPYCPEFVYRAILKMALSVLPADDVVQYDFAFKFLLHPESFDNQNKFKNIIITETAINLARPFAQLYKKRGGINSPRYAEHAFCLFTGPFMFQLFIPGNVNDDYLLHNKVALLPAPYFQLNTFDTHDDIIFRRSVEDLHSTERIKRDISLNMKFSTGNLVSIDLGKDFVKSMNEKF